MGKRQKFADKFRRKINNRADDFADDLDPETYNGEIEQAIAAFGRILCTNEPENSNEGESGESYVEKRKFYIDYIPAPSDQTKEEVTNRVTIKAPTMSHAKIFFQRENPGAQITMIVQAIKDESSKKEE